MSGFLLLRIKQIIRETPDAATFVLERSDREGRPGGRGTVPYKAGQFLTLIFERHGKEVRRSYSLSSAPGIDEDLRITVKQVENGEFSRYLLRELKEGDVLKALYPAGRFTLPPTIPGPADVFLLAAGSGIVPVFSILKTLMAGYPGVKTTLIYSNWSERSTIFRDEINALAEKYPSRLKVLHVLSHPGERSHLSESSFPPEDSLPPEDSRPPGRSAEGFPVELSSGGMIHGHVSNQQLERLVEQYRNFDKSKALFFICGPFTYMRMAQITLRVAGFRQEQLHKENFVVNEPLPPRFAFPEGRFPREVVLVRGERTDHFPVAERQTVLDAAREFGIELPFSCKAGVCATCAAHCVSGEVKMSVNEVLTARDLERGLVLTCVAYPVTEKVRIEIEI